MASSRKWKDLEGETQTIPSQTGHAWKYATTSDNDSISPSKPQQPTIRVVSNIEIPTNHIMPTPHDSISLTSTNNETPISPVIHVVAEITTHSNSMPEPSHHILSPPIIIYQPPAPPLHVYEINDHIINQSFTHMDDGFVPSEPNWTSTFHQSPPPIPNQSTDFVPQEPTWSPTFSRQPQLSHPTINPSIAPTPISVPSILATTSTINVEPSYPSVEPASIQSVNDPSICPMESNPSSTSLPSLTQSNSSLIDTDVSPNRLSMYQAAMIAVQKQHSTVGEDTTTAPCNQERSILDNRNIITNNSNNNNIDNSSSSSSSSTTNNDNNQPLHSTHNLDSTHETGLHRRISTTMTTIQACTKLHPKNKRTSPKPPSTLATKIFSFFSGGNYNNFVDLTSKEVGDLLLKMGPKTMEREIRWKIPSYEVWKCMEKLGIGKPPSNVENNAVGSSEGHEEMHHEVQSESSYPAYVMLHYYELFKVLDIDGEQLYDLDEDQLNEVLQEPPPSGMGIENVLHRKKIQKLIVLCREDSLTLLSVILEQPLIVAMVSLMPAIMAPILEGMPLQQAAIIVVITVILLLYLGYYMVKNHKKKKE